MNGRSTWRISGAGGTHGSAARAGLLLGAALALLFVPASLHPVRAQTSESTTPKTSEAPPTVVAPLAPPPASAPPVPVSQSPLPSTSAATPPAPATASPPPTASTGDAPATGDDAAFRLGLEAAFKGTKLLDGLDLGEIERHGRRRTLDLGEHGKLVFFRLPDGAEEEDDEETADRSRDGTGETPAADVSSETSAETATAPPAEPSDGPASSRPAAASPVAAPPKPAAAAQDTSATTSLLEPEPLDGTFFVAYERDRLRLSELSVDNGKDVELDLAIEDAVFLYSSKAETFRLSKLALPSKTGRYLRDFAKDRRYIDLPAGGLLFGTVKVGDDAYLDSLDRALNFKETELQLKGGAGPRMLRRLLKLDKSKGKAGFTADDLTLEVTLEGFRPPKIGRYVDAREMVVTLKADDEGKLDLSAVAEARFGIGARKVKVPATIQLEPDATGEEAVFTLTATANEHDLRSIKIQTRNVQDLEFTFWLTQEFEPRLRAEGHTEKDGIVLPVAGELDEEDGKDLFQLDGLSLEAVSGLDIPGLDELQLPDVPALNERGARSFDTKVRNRPAKLLIGPMARDEASYVALSVDGGGIESLIPVGMLGDLGTLETGHAIYLYLPKGRAPPSLGELPGDFRALFTAGFTAEDLAVATTGLTLFQTSTFSAAHPFSKAVSVFSQGNNGGESSIKVVGRIDPLVFDEPEDDVSRTWSSTTARQRLKKVLATLSLDGHIAGLQGLGLGNFFRLEDTAAFEFRGTRSGDVTAQLSFVGELQLRGAAEPRRYDFVVKQGTAGQFAWRGDEIDAAGRARPGGRYVTLAGRIDGKEVSDLSLTLAGSYRLGDVFATQVEGLSDLELQDLWLGKGYAQASVGKGGARSSITVVDRDGVGLATLAVGPGVKPAAYLPGLTNTPLADLALPSSVLVIASEGVDRRTVQALPNRMDEILLAAMDEAGIEPAPGVTFLSKLGFDGDDVLGRLARRLGMPANDQAVLHGRVPAAAVAALAGGGRRNNAGDLAGFALEARLPRMALPGVDKLFRLSDVTTMTLAGGADGALTAQLTTTGTFTLPVVNTSEEIDLTATVTGTGRQRELSVVADSRSLGSDGTAKLKLRGSAPLDLADVKAAAAGFVVTAESGMTLSDLLGREVPGIGGLTLSDATMSLDHVSGTLRLGESRVVAGIAALGRSGAAADRILTLEAVGLPGAAAIPGLSKTPLKDIKLDHALAAYLPNLPENAEGLAISDLPDSLADLRQAFAADGRDTVARLRSGLNLVSLVDTNDLGPLKPLLEKLKAIGGGKKLRLTASMPGDALAFLGEKVAALKTKLTTRNSKRKGGGVTAVKAKVAGLASSLLPKIVREVDVKLPLPGISLPGIGEHLSSTAGELRLTGFEDPATNVTGLRTTIVSALRFAVPGTPTSGTIDSELVVAVDGTKNITTELAGTGTLDNVAATATLSGRLGLKETAPDLRIAIAGSGLTLGKLTGLTVPGVTDLALNRAELKPGELSGEVELKGAMTKVAAFDFAKGRTPVLALVSSGGDLAKLVPGVAGTPLDAATLETASFLFVPQGRHEALAGVELPAIFRDVLDPAAIEDGLNVELKVAPKGEGELARMLNAVGLNLSGPLEVEGRLPGNLFTAGRDEVIRNVRLHAALPRLGFDKVGAVSIAFSEAPRLSVEGSEEGLAATVETGLTITLPAVDRTFSGTGSFAIVPKEGGGRQLRFAANTVDPGGRNASLEAFMDLPGRPADFRVRFAGEQTLSSLLGVDIPVIGDLNLSELERGPDFLTAKLTLRSAETSVGAFKADGRWAVAVSASGVKPADFIPGMDDLPVKDLILPAAMFVFVPPAGGGAGATLPFDPTTLPREVREALAGVLAPFKGGSTLAPGLNLVSLLDPAKIPGLKRVFAFTGSGGSGPLKLTGKLPSLSLAALTSKGSAFKGMAKDRLRDLVAGVDLDTSLPAVNLPGVREVVQFGDPHLRIKGDDADGAIKLAMAIAGDMRLTLPNVTPLDLAGRLALAAAADGIALDVSGTGSRDGKEVAVAGRVVLTKTDPSLQLAFTSDVSVGDLIGDRIPGLADLALVDARFGSEIIAGTVEFRGARTTLAALDFKRDKNPFVALISEQLDAANVIPGIAGSPLDNARLSRGALLYVPDGKTAFPSGSDLPEAVAEAIAFVSRDGTAVPDQGLKAGFNVEFKEGAPLTQALTYVGYKKTSVELRGSLPVALLHRPGRSGGISSGAVRSGAGKAVVFAGEALKSAIRGVDLEATLPAINLPGIDQVIRFGDPVLRVNGTDEIDTAGNATGDVILRVGVDSNMTLKLPGHDMVFDGGFDIAKAAGGKAFKLALRGHAGLDWKQAFGLPFLELREIALGGGIERGADGAAKLAANLSSKLKLDKLAFDSTAAIELSSAGLPEVRFSVDNKLRVADLPGLGGVKGLDEVAFSNLWVGTGGLGGRVEIEKLGLGGEGVLFLHGGKPVMILRADQLTLGDLLGKGGSVGESLKQMWDPLLGIAFPNSLFAMSTTDLSSVKVSALPAAVQPILKGLVAGDEGMVPFGNGISLVAALDENNLPPSIREAVSGNDDFNVFDTFEGPMLLAGSLDGLFNGALKVRLLAKLPSFKFPQNQPWQKVVSVDRAGVAGLMYIDVPNTQFGLGVTGDITVDVPHLAHPREFDKLKFRGDLVTSFDAVSWAGSFKAAGSMQGNWRSPLGLAGNLTVADPAIQMGVDTEGSVEFGFGGDMTVAGLSGGRSVTQRADFLVNVNFSTSIPLPKKLAFGYQVEGDINQLTMLEIQEALLKGVLTGPMANEIVKILPDQASRDGARYLQAELKKRSLREILQIEQIPLPLVTYNDPYIYFATPGAKLLGREKTLDSMGVRLSGGLTLEVMGKKYRLGGTDMRLTLSDGLIMKGDIADVNFAPGGGANVLSLKNAKMDIVANIKQIPHFKLSGDVELLGAKERLDSEFSKDRIAFHYEKDLGRLIRMKIDAETDSGDVVKAREFIIQASTKTEIDTLLTDTVLPALGIPKAVGDIIAKRNPLFISGGRFKGKVVDFAKGNPVTLEIDHKFFGTEMPPAKAEVVPVWTDPLRAFPHEQIAKALTVSFFHYIREHPIDLGRVNLGLVSIEEAVLSAESDSSQRFRIRGRLNALGLPFSETTAILDNRNGVVIDSATEVVLPLPLGALGTLGKGWTTLHYELNPGGLSHKVNLKVSTAALGFEDNIHFDLAGTMDATTVSFRSDNPCARFSSSSSLDAGDLRNFAFKVSQQSATPADFIRLISFNPQISLPGPGDAVKCGARILVVAQKAIDFAQQGLNEVAKVVGGVLNIAASAFNIITEGLRKLDCSLFKLGDCPSPSDCRGDERWNTTLKRCWRPDHLLVKHFSYQHQDKNWCMDISGADNRDGAQVIPWDCHGKWNQSWKLLPDGRLQNAKGRCLAVHSYRQNEPVQTYSCGDRDVLYLDYRDTGQVSTHLRNGQRGLCLALEKDEVRLWRCGDIGTRHTDLWVLYDPVGNEIVNPAAGRAQQILQAAFTGPIQDDPPVPLLRYRNSSNGERRFTIDPDELGRGRNGFSYEATLGYVFRERAPGTVPLFKYWRQTGNIRNYVLTTNVGEYGGGAHGFNLIGALGYVYPSELPGTRPLYRFHENHNKNYLFVIDEGERSRLRRDGNFRYEGVMGYVVAGKRPPEMPAVERSNPEALFEAADVLGFPLPPDKDARVVYQYIDRKSHRTYYTADFGEHGGGSFTHDYAGVAGYLFGSDRSGAVPVYQADGGRTLTTERKRASNDMVLGYAVGPDFGPGKDAKVVNVAAVPLLRYFNPSTNDHMYTGDPNQLGDGDDGYVRDGVAGAIFPGRVKGTVPLYRYWNDASKDHIFTTDFHALLYGKDGYDYIGVEGYVYPSEQRGMLALHRYVNDRTRDNLLTTDFDEFGGTRGRDGFRYAGVEGWVPPAPAPGTEAKVASAKPEDFLRYRHPDTGDHRMARGVGAVDAERDGYRLEHPLGAIHPERAKDTVPLYEYTNGRDTLYTDDYDELGPGKDGYAYRRIIGWVHPKEVAGTVPLHRYRNGSTGDHLLTSDLEELGGKRGKDGYAYEGVVGWVPPFQAPGTDAPFENSEPLPLVRYFNPQTGDHRLTLGTKELGEGALGYEIESYQGRLWPKRATGTVPLYHYVNDDRGDHLYTHEFGEYWQGRDGYAYKGILGYVHPAETKGVVALHRYFGRTSLDTLLTTDFDELNGKSGRDSYHYARIEGWVLPFVPPGLDAKAEKSSPLPLVRYRDPQKGTFALTAGSSIYGTDGNGLRIERTVGRIFTKRADGTVPLYQYTHGANGGRVYTTDFGELLFGKRGYAFDGVVGYLYPAERAGTVALHRYDDPARGASVLTVDPDEFGGKAGKDGYRYTGVVGWVPGYPERPVDGFADVYVSTNDNFSCLETDDRPDTILSSRLCGTDGDFHFTLWQDGSVRHASSGLCLGVAGKSSDRAAVSTLVCDYTDAQQWEIRWAGGRAPARPDGITRMQFVHKPSGKCLGLQDASGQDGVEADLHPCANPGDNAQSWVMSTTVPSYVVPGTDAPVAASEPTLLARYVNRKGKTPDHMTVVGLETFGRGKDGYLPDVLLGRLHATRATPGMVPLYRYRHARTGDHLFTADFHEHRFGAEGYRFEEIVGFVDTEEKPGTVPLHRYVNAARGDTLLASDFKEWGGASGRDGYRYDGIVGWTPGTGAESPAPWNRVYVANLGGMVCLEADGGEAVASRRCEDAESQQLSFWSDGTVRFGDRGECLQAEPEAGGVPVLADCNNDLRQRWEIAWQREAPPAAADGKTALQLVNWRSGQCLVLADGTGVDGVAANMSACTNFAARDRRGTWWAHAEVPTFVPPGIETPVASSTPVPLIRYHSAKAKGRDHRLAAGPEELGLGRDGYEMQRAQGKIFPKRPEGGVPLYRYYSAAAADHHVTADFRQHGWSAHGYEYRGILGYVLGEQQADTVALHAYASAGDHAVTDAPAEFGGAAGKGGYAYEGVEAWAPRYPEEPTEGFQNLYLSTNGHLSCLEAETEDDSAVRSSFCGDHEAPQFSFWQDGTLRRDEANLCLQPGQASGGTQPVVASRCAYTRAQQFEMRWGGSKPGRADGTAAMQIVHKPSGRCIGLADASGQDGVAAVLLDCAAKDSQVLAWVAGQQPPEFVPPGMDAVVQNVEPKTFIRYAKGKDHKGDHQMQVGPEPYGLGKDGYDMEKAQGRIFPAHAAGTVPLYRYVDRAAGDHIYTSDFHEFRYAKERTEYDGIVGYVYPAEKPGAVALHRYVNAAKGDHLLAARFDEFNGKGGRDGYKYDGIVGWVPDYPEYAEAGFDALYLATNKNLSCLDAAAEAGAPVRSSFCHDHDTPQFSFWQDGTLRRNGGHLCLTLPANPRAGAAVKVERCSYTSDRQWTVQWDRGTPAAADGGMPLRLVHADSGLCLELADASGQDGVAAVAARCTRDAESVQVWTAHAKRPTFVPPGADAPVGEPETLPFLRYVNARSRNGDHLMQVGPEPFGLGKDGYDLEKAQGSLFVGRAPETVPLYSYVDRAKGDHIYTSDFHEFRYANGDTVYDGVIGYLYPAKRNDAQPLHRYGNATKGDHLLAVDLQEFGGKSGREGYAYDGVVGWVPPYDETPMDGFDAVHLATNGNLSCIDAAGGVGDTVRSAFCPEAATPLLSFRKDGTLRSDRDRQCLTLPSNARAGNAVEIARCGYTSNQQWGLQWDGRAPQAADGGQQATLVHEESGLCVGLADASGQNGVELVAGRCPKGADNVQTWRLDKSMPKFVPPGTDTPVAAAQPVPFVRYVKQQGSVRDHRMMAGYEELGVAEDGYAIEHPIGTIVTARGQGTVPLYRYRGGKHDDHLYTSDFHELRYARDGYHYDGIVGYVRAEKTGDLVALHRYRNPRSGDHVLTTDGDEFGGRGGRDGYAYEHVVGWVPPYSEKPLEPLESVYATTEGWMCLSPVREGQWAQIEYSPCRQNDAWRLTHYDDGSLRPAGSDLCVTVGGGKVFRDLDPCRYRDPRQVFEVLWNAGSSRKPAADGKRTFRIRHVDSSRCLLAPEASASAGAGLQFVACAGQNGGKNQNWRAFAKLPVPEVAGPWRSMLLSGGNELCATTRRRADGWPLVVEDCAPSTELTFSLYADGSIRHDPSGRCLSVPDVASSKTPVTLETCLVRNVSQTFELLWSGNGKATKAPDGTKEFQIRHTRANLCLGVRGGTWKSGQAVVLAKCASRSGRPAQNWRFSGVVSN